eukprot:925148-Pyramimonas_sp.AAC.1
MLELKPSLDIMEKRIVLVGSRYADSSYDSRCCVGALLLGFGAGRSGPPYRGAQVVLAQEAYGLERTQEGVCGGRVSSGVALAGRGGSCQNGMLVG